MKRKTGRMIIIQRFKKKKKERENERINGRRDSEWK